MSDEWVVTFGQGVWKWTRSFPNGWSAVVIDDSESRTPPEKTSYRAGSTCAHYQRILPESHAALRDAKHAAIQHTLHHEKCKGAEFRHVPGEVDPADEWPFREAA